MIKLCNNLIFAPLAGYTTPPIRHFFSVNGAGLCITEMVSAKAILHNNEKTKALLIVSKKEKIRSAQLFGSDPSDFAKAIAHPWLSEFDIIDINMGCPVKKITSNGEGSQLMADAKKAGDIVEAAAKAAKSVGKVVTVKTRLGIKHKEDILKFAPVLEEAGASMICIHGRTAEQMYSGEADYQMIGKVKTLIKKAVFCANGDIIDKASFERIKMATKADYFMIGRGALYDTQIFNKLLNNNFLSKKDSILELISCLEKFYDGSDTCIMLRKFLPYMLKGVRGGKEFRISMNYCDDINILKKGVNQLF
ncbi:MAG: tRNA-dihydrouridine synthase family protein [Firmicutes bacterium]|nr:tRNA-dihydrouridine synthase family protein [Bacillota bacterium]